MFVAVFCVTLPVWNPIDSLVGQHLHYPRFVPRSGSHASTAWIDDGAVAAALARQHNEPSCHRTTDGTEQENPATCYYFATLELH